MNRMFLLLTFFLILSYSIETEAQWQKISLHGAKVSYSLKNCDYFPRKFSTFKFPYKYEVEARIPERVDSLDIDLTSCTEPETVLNALSGVPSRYLDLTGLKTRESVEILNLFITENLTINLSKGIDPAPIFASLKRKALIWVMQNEAPLLVPFLSNENISSVCFSTCKGLKKENSEAVLAILNSKCPLNMFFSPVSSEETDLILSYGEVLRNRESVDFLLHEINEESLEIISVLPVAKDEHYFCFDVSMLKLLEKEFSKNSKISVSMNDCTNEKEFLEGILEKGVHVEHMSIEAEKLASTISAIVKLSPSRLSIDGDEIVEGVDLSLLKDIPLESLSLDFESSKPLDLTWVSGVDTLSELTAKVPLSPESCEAIASMKGLRSLRISDNDTKNLRKCFSNPYLDCISMDLGNKAVDADILAGIASEKLAILIISNLDPPLKLEDAAVKRLSSLKHLEFSNCEELTGEDLLKLCSKQLRYMVVDGCSKVGEGTIKEIVSKNIYVEYKAAKPRKEETFESCLDGMVGSFHSGLKEEEVQRLSKILENKFGYRAILGESWFLVVPVELKDKNTVFYSEDWGMFEARNLTKEEVSRLVKDIHNLKTIDLLEEKYPYMKWKIWEYYERILNE